MLLPIQYPSHVMLCTLLGTRAANLCLCWSSRLWARPDTQRSPHRLSTSDCNSCCPSSTLETHTLASNALQNNENCVSLVLNKPGEETLLQSLLTNSVQCCVDVLCSNRPDSMSGRQKDPTGSMLSFQPSPSSPSFPALSLRDPTGHCRPGLARLEAPCPRLCCC